ncbi:MerC domain-containing protein [uncultured Croceitalea sp.]|uniref:MerC domain-containing protein n=1 Tax=uncultured Croceitalea sp. TaxID=1798908 RepID=UPI00330689FD
MSTFKALSSNNIGAIASVLCLIHCLATPFIFLVQAGVLAFENSHQQWWGLLDLVFLVISLLAVWRSGKTTSKPSLGLALWISWIFLAFIVLNEKLTLFQLPEETIYFPSLALVFFHLYNKKYCKCKGEECCTHR